MCTTVCFLKKINYEFSNPHISNSIRGKHWDIVTTRNITHVNRTTDRAKYNTLFGSDLNVSLPPPTGSNNWNTSATNNKYNK